MQVDSAPSLQPGLPTDDEQAGRLPQAGFQEVANHLKFLPQSGVLAVKHHAGLLRGVALGKPAIGAVDPRPGSP